MNQFSTTTTGIFPKIGGDAPSLRANLHKLDREEISAEELETILQKNIERAVAEQITAGIDLPTDGLIRWTDLFSPFVKSWGGLTRRGIHRFYDTNTLYGEPVVESELEFVASQNAADFAIAKEFGAKKATLPGVFTFAAACVDSFYNDAKKLREVLAQNLLLEAEKLIESGAEIIEIHEPELGWNENDAAEITAIYSKFGELNCKILVVSYFRNFSQATIQALITSKVGIGIDFTKTLELENLEIPFLQIGIVDARETKLESVEVLAKRKADALIEFPDSEIIFSTTSHPEYLPHAIAIAKINLLKNFK